MRGLSQADRGLARGVPQLAEHDITLCSAPVHRLGPVLLGALLSGALAGAAPGVASAATAQCLHEPPPSPPAGGAVFALPFDSRA